LTSRQACRNAVVFSLALLARSEAGAEGTSGGLLGWVEDSRGTPVSGAMISLFGKGIGGRGLLTLTDSNGRFFLPSLPPGRYTLRALSEGQPSVVARQVTVLPNRDAVFTLSLTPIAAGAALGPVVATSPAEGESSRELEWLLRHKRRSALESRRNDAAQLLRPEPCPSGFRCPESRDPSLLAGTFEFLAGPTSLSAGLSPTEENAASLGLVRLHGRIADSVRWSLGGLATESENATWRMGAEFIVEPGGGHELRAGSGYGARTMSPQLVPSDASRDGESALERSTGSIFLEDRWRVAEAVRVTVGARYSYIGFVERGNHFDASTSVEVGRSDRRTLRGSVSTRTLAPGGDLLTLSTLAATPAIALAVMDRSLRPEKAVRADLAFRQALGRSTTATAHAFRESVDEPLVNRFEGGGAGVLRISNGDPFTARGAGVGVEHRFCDSVRGSVSYTFGRVRRSAVAESGDADMSEIPLLAQEEASYRDLLARVETVIDQTGTRIAAVYRLNTLHPRRRTQNPPRTPLASRFDVQLSQGLPFLGSLTSADWEVLVAVRNLFYETGEGGTLDELLVANAPTRVLGGISVRF
jgi:hypothetical protein